MSGGCSWLMKKHVFDKIQYDSSEIYSMSNLKDYQDGKHNEDTYFAQRCRRAGFKIKHNHASVAIHDDPTYTNLGRFARRRQNGRTQEWVKSMDLDFPPEVIVQFAAALYNSGLPAESADVLRMGLERHFKNQIFPIFQKSNISNVSQIKKSNISKIKNGTTQRFQNHLFRKQLIFKTGILIIYILMPILTECRLSEIYLI